jgi:hypothetical protein
MSCSHSVSVSQCSSSSRHFLRLLEIESDLALVAIVVESIKNFPTRFYSPFSILYSGSYGHMKIAVDFQSITMICLSFWALLKCPS